MTMPLRSDPITGPSTLLRASPPLCPASVLRPSRRLAAWVSPFASGRQVPVFLTEACLEVTPPSCRTPVGPSAGSSQPLLAGYASDPGFDVNGVRYDTSSAVHSRSSPQDPPDRITSPFSSNAHHAGSLPSQLVAV